jgi:hypothetical protein
MVLAPVVVPAVVAVGRPLLRSLLRGGVIAYQKSRESLAGLSEALEDVVAEVSAELDQDRETQSEGARSARSA